MPSRLIVLVVVVAGYLVPSVPAHASGPALITGGITTHVVMPGDTLTSLAARFGVDGATIVSDNHLVAGRSLEPGREILIDNRHIAPAPIAAGEIVINLPQRMLFYGDGDDVLAYPIAVGRPTWQTPRGPFAIVERQQDPTWHVPASIRAESARKGRELPLAVPPGPRNPLGRFWLGLSLGSIGIHGTVAPSSIYQTATHGCIRLQGDSIEDLYGRVDVGTRGRIVYEPILMTASSDGIYLEVNRDVYGRAAKSPLPQVRELARRLAVNDRIDWTVAEEVIERREGIARRISISH